ncbi:MAG: hypothetical protein KME09_04695 [Pleurocapsa minor HA4230-MV1]|jgi:hypothetical protein|nr:hypothetical protein [Pleurocapsa minor HA4230-MV1]
MGYVQELRSLVGHRPLIIPGAAVLIVNQQGDLLLQHRKDNQLLKSNKKLSSSASRLKYWVHLSSVGIAHTTTIDGIWI